MKKYEYNIVDKMIEEGTPLIKYLNELGAKGWDVHVSRSGPIYGKKRMYHFYMKREVV